METSASVSLEAGVYQRVLLPSQIRPGITAGSCGTEGSLKTASAPRASSQSVRSVKVPPTSTPIARTAPPFESVECTLRPNHEGLCLRSPALAPPLAAVLLSRPERALRPGAGHAGLRRASRADGPVRGVRLRRRLHERAPQQAVRADAVPQPDRGGADPADEAHQDRHPRQPAGAARPPRAAGRGDRDARLHVG